jgi:hypothetical protein
MRNMYLAIFTICLLSIIVLAWYQSLPHPHNGSTGYWVIYTLTPNDNHTQIQPTYSNGTVTTEQITWLHFDNTTAVYNYFKCTPSLPGCTVDGCPFTVLDDTATEYRVKIVCPPGT